MTPFVNLLIESKHYPTVILGEDSFTGWFGKGNFASEGEREDQYRLTLETAYALGVRGFAISPHQTLLKTLRKFKKAHPDAICICNPHWQLNYYIHNESLWTNKNIKRLNATISQKLGSTVNIDFFWLQESTDVEPFDDGEISRIHINETEYFSSLSIFKDFCDFSVVGNIGHSALPLIGRTDIVEKEIEIVRKIKLTPIGMCQGGGLALTVYEKLDIEACWIWINKYTSFPNLHFTLNALSTTQLNLTAFRIFDNPHGFDLKGSMNFIHQIKQIKSVLVGVDNYRQAEENFSHIRRLCQ